jgi:hypothetical protein
MSSKETYTRFMEIIQWYGYHKKNVQSADLRKTVELQGKMIDELFTLLTMVYRDQRLDAARARGFNGAASPIVMPANMGGAIPFKRKFDA